MSWISNILSNLNIGNKSPESEKITSEKTEADNGIFNLDENSESYSGDSIEINSTDKNDESLNINGGNISDLIKEKVNNSVDTVKNIINSIPESGKVVGEKISEIADKAFKFITKTVAELPFKIINDELKIKNKKEVKDSDLSNTYEYNKLTNEDMLLLSNIAYTDIANVSNKGKMLGDVVSELKMKLQNSDNPNVIDEDGNITAEGIKELRSNGFNTRTVDDEAFSKIFNEILNEENLYTLTILDNADQAENYVNATTHGHLDENGMLKENATVVFMGTGSATGWEDNAFSLYQSDTKMQKAAYEYMLRQQYVLDDYSSNPNEVHVSVTGHSKGGNLAMYSTIRCAQDDNLDDGTIIVDNCVSFNGQGFNEEFIGENQELINKSKEKITAINTYFDPVSSLLNPVAGTTWNVEAQVTKSPTDENGNINLKNKDEIGSIFWDGHCHTAMYKDINKNSDGEDTWKVCQKSDMANVVASVCDAVENISEKDSKKFLSNVLAGVFIDIFGGGDTVRSKDSKKVSEPLIIPGFDLQIVKTESGYNIYSSDYDSGNTVATLSPDGNVDSGVLEPFLKGHTINELLTSMAAVIKTM